MPPIELLLRREKEWEDASGYRFVYECISSFFSSTTSSNICFKSSRTSILQKVSTHVPMKMNDHMFSQEMKLLLLDVNLHVNTPTTTTRTPEQFVRIYPIVSISSNLFLPTQYTTQLSSALVLLM